jgi:hypothetical protein
MADQHIFQMRTSMEIIAASANAKMKYSAAIAMGLITSSKNIVDSPLSSFYNDD